MEEYSLNCDCHSHKVTFCYDKHDDTFYNILWFIAGHSFGFFDRLKLAWQIIIKHDALIYDIVIRGDELRSFLTWLDKCTPIRKNLNERE